MTNSIRFTQRWVLGTGYSTSKLRARC